MTTIPIYMMEAFKNLFLQNQLAGGLETWYVASGTYTTKISLKATGSYVTKVHAELSGAEETKICPKWFRSHGPHRGHDKNPSKISSGTNSPMALKLDM